MTLTGTCQAVCLKIAPPTVFAIGGFRFEIHFVRYPLYFQLFLLLLSENFLKNENTFSTENQKDEARCRTVIMMIHTVFTPVQGQ